MTSSAPSSSRANPRTLAIITAPLHYRWQGRLWSYGPYAREIDLWADLFDEIRLVGPWRDQAPPDDAVPFERSNIVAAPMLETGGPRLFDKLRQLVLIPVLCFQIVRQVRRADAVHLRAPATSSLLASLLTPLLGRPMTAKYAGQWTPYDGERTVVALQRWLLRVWFRGPVTVYGRQPNDPDHIIGFFTAMTSRSQVEQAVANTRHKTLNLPLRIVFSGRLFPGKGVLELIRAVRIVRDQKVAISLRLVGDGPLMAKARALIEDLELSPQVELLGAMPHHGALEQLAWADVLVLASRHEGWPKVLTEAMIHHCLCITSPGGLMGEMVEGRGVVLADLSPQAIADAIILVDADRDHYQELLAPAAQWASRFSREDLRSAIKKLLEDQWQCQLRALPEGADGRRSEEPQ